MARLNDIPKRRIKATVWDNWYGYEGRKRVRTFGASSQFTAEQHARQWLHKHAMSPEGVGRDLPTSVNQFLTLVGTVNAEIKRSSTSLIYRTKYSLVAGTIKALAVRCGLVMKSGVTEDGTVVIVIRGLKAN